MFYTVVTGCFMLCYLFCFTAPCASPLSGTCSELLVTIGYPQTCSILQTWIKRPSLYCRHWRRSTSAALLTTLLVCSPYVVTHGHLVITWPLNALRASHHSTTILSTGYQTSLPSRVASNCRQCMGDVFLTIAVSRLSTSPVFISAITPIGWLA